jgi:hypothetical protein
VAWDALAVFLLVGGLAGVAAGLLVLALGPRRPANQVLATILVAQGLFPQGVLNGFVAAGVGPSWFADATMQGVRLAITAIGFLHLIFIGQAIPHRSVQWIRTPLGAGSVFAAWGLAMWGALSGDVTEVQLVAGLAAAYSAVVAWLEMRSRPRGSAAWSRARAYFVAFVVRDIALGWQSASTAVDEVAGIGDGPYMVGRAIMLVSHILVVLALLRGQVLGLNHKLAAGTSGALAAGVLATAFVVITETIESAVAGDQRSVGIVAAVVLTFLFRPLQAASQRALQRLFPSARPIAALDLAERRRLYAEQVELAWADGVLGDKERRMLDRMARSLGLPAAMGRPERA